MLISTVLVLGMSPALALFEAGMLRSKNTLSVITQVLSGIIALSVIWVLFGYSLTFGEDAAGFIGNFNEGLWIHVSYYRCSVHAPTIPAACYALFQMMFAVITPLLMTGAFAERMKFRVYFIFVIVWEIFVYYPVAHWIWGGGWLQKWGALDFAGGIVVHTTAGAGALVSAILMGPRAEFHDFHGEFPPSSLPLAAVGLGLLWIGWFGFNGGSALVAGNVAVSAVVSTQIGGSVSACVWLLLAWWRGAPTSTALMNGALAGLAGITPATGYIGNGASLILGLILGVCSYFGAHILKHKWHIDDALEVSMVHGLTGVIGSLAIGFFADTNVNGGGGNGVWFGGKMLLLYQFVAIIVAAAWAGAWTFIWLKVLDKVFGGIRISEHDERIGMDWAEHKEVAYHKLHVLEEQQTTVLPNGATDATTTYALSEPFLNSDILPPHNDDYRRSPDSPAFGRASRIMATQVNATHLNIPTHLTVQGGRP